MFQLLNYIYGMCFFPFRDFLGFGGNHHSVSNATVGLRPCLPGLYGYLLAFDKINFAKIIRLLLIQQYIYSNVT